MQITCGNRLLLSYLAVCIANDNSCKPLLQVCNVACQTQNRHNLGCYCNIIAVLSGHSIGLSAESVHYVTKLTVIHIHTSSPGNLSRINVQRMEITGKVKIDILHRNYLCVSAAGRSAFYTEYRSKGRLTKRYHNLLAKLLHTICKTYGSSSLSFSCRSRIDSRYQNQFPVRSIRLF